MFKTKFLTFIKTIAISSIFYIDKTSRFITLKSLKILVPLKHMNQNQIKMNDI